MKSSKGFSLLIAAVLLCFAFFLAWHHVSDAALRFNLADTELMLETSYGRERKQNKEHEDYLESITKAEEKLALLLPQVEAADAESTSLKETRKQLRAERDQLLASQPDKTDPADAPTSEQSDQSPASQPDKAEPTDTPSSEQRDQSPASLPDKTEPAATSPSEPDSVQTESEKAVKED